MPIAKSSRLFCFHSTIFHHANLLRFAVFEQCLPKSCFCFIHPSTKGGAIMQLLTHIIFVLNLLKTLINHFT